MSLPLLQHAADLLDSVLNKSFIKFNHHFIRPLSQEFCVADHWCFWFWLLKYIKSWLSESISSCQELNAWFFSAPQFPASPLALADALARAEHPLLRFFTAVRQAQKKEARPEILWKRTLAGFSEVGCPETVETVEIWSFHDLFIQWKIAGTAGCWLLRRSWLPWRCVCRAFGNASRGCESLSPCSIAWVRDPVVRHGHGWNFTSIIYPLPR